MENSQVAVYLACTTKEEHCLLDTRLYLPESWTNDPPRCHRAGVPESVSFQTKPNQNRTG
ncbi:transposase [Endozoicomonas lisbonensis]|uniref:transposase n=1 Tax=Endozoicomonas lisbonensis TaxID=3120522 RepID=UPI00339500C3